MIKCKIHDQKKMKNWFLTGGNLRKKAKKVTKNLKKLVMWGRRKKCDLQFAKERFKMCQTYDHKERKSCCMGTKRE